jgi:hypothetical protein
MNHSRHLLRLGLVAFAALAAASATAQTNRDYSAFKLVADRNIFDPNRYPHNATRHESRRPGKTVDAFSLVGVMSYEKGNFAFFDGSSSDYRKVLKPSDSIAGFQITEVSQNQVKLTSGTNQIVMAVGSQMRRQEEGDWAISDTAIPIASSGQTDSSSSSGSDSSASSPAPPGGTASDILKKLMERRQQQLNR